MKKIFLTVLTLCLMIGGVASAQENAQANAQTNYNFVRVSDFDPQAYVERMVKSALYQHLAQNGTVVAFVSPVRREDLDDPQNFQGLVVYKSDFGIKDAPNPEGHIRFYVDPEGHVFVVQLINEGNPQVSGMVLVMALDALGLNEQEGNVLLQTQTVVAETWCANAGRKILRVVADQEGNNVLLFGATE